MNIYRHAWVDTHVSRHTQWHAVATIHMHEDNYSNVHPHTQTQIFTHTHINIHTRTHSQIFNNIYKHSRTHTCTNIHTYIQKNTHTKYERELIVSQYKRCIWLVSNTYPRRKYTFFFLYLSQGIRYTHKHTHTNASIQTRVNTSHPKPHT